MKVTKVNEYEAGYPRKNGVAARVGALAAAALIAGASAGCRSPKPTISGAPAVDPTPEITEEVVLDGDVAVEETPIVSEVPDIMGEIMPDPGSIEEPEEGGDSK